MVNRLPLATNGSMPITRFLLKFGVTLKNDRLHLFALLYCAFTQLSYALGRWTAAVAPGLGDQDGFLLNTTNLTARPDRPGAMLPPGIQAQLTL